MGSGIKYPSPSFNLKQMRVKSLSYSPLPLGVANAALPSDAGKARRTMEKTAKAVKEAIVGERMPKFGLGQKQKEMECEKIHVYMQCLLGGGVVMEPIRALLSPSQTIEDARKVYVEARGGRPLQQSRVRDENGYLLERSLEMQTLARFSNACQLNLSFSYAEDVSVKSMKTAADAGQWLKSQF